jgi:hypothetical protein
MDYPFPEVKDVRPGKEQGTTDLWGILEALAPAYFSISIKEELYALLEGFQERKKRCRQFQGTAFRRLSGASGGDMQ